MALHRAEVDRDRLGDSVFGHGAAVGGLEAEDYIGFGYAPIAEFLGDVDFGAIVLEPDFLVDDVEVEDAAIDAPIVFPADVDDLVVVALGVKVALGVDFWGGAAAAVVAEDVLDDLAVLV
jgi:hypothetical protein